MKNTNKKNIKDQILNSIETGNILQKPKWHFALRIFFAVLSIILILLISVYLISFISLITGEIYWFDLLGISGHGIQAFFLGTPWVLLIIIALLFVLLNILIRHFEFAYKVPVVTTLIITTFFIVIIAYAFEKFDTEHKIARFGEEKGNPMSFMHDEYRAGRKGDMIIGNIKEITSSGFIIELRRGTTTTEVIVSDKTKMDKNRKIEIGQNVIVLGKENNGKVEAIAVKIRQQNEVRGRIHIEPKL